MKIAFVIYDLDKGGAERVVSLLSLELAKEHDVKIIIFGHQIKYQYGGKIIFLNTPSNKNSFLKGLNIFKRVYKLKKVFKEEKFDEIFSFMESANFVTSLSGYNAFLSIRTNPHRFSSLTIYLMKKLYTRSNINKVICVSNEIARSLNEYEICHTKVIYNPLDFELIQKLKKEKLHNFKNYIISVGRLHEVKNFDLLIRSFSKTKAKEQLKLLILGEGSQRKALERLIDTLDLKNKVILVGAVDNVYSYLYYSKIFILSSKFEGFPNTLIEALACNVPSISVDCPTGPKEIINHNENGVLVENENEKELTKAIDNLYFDMELQEKLKKTSLESIKNLNIKDIAQQWLSL